MEIRQRAEGGTRPGLETSPAGAVTMRVVGATAIALAASMAIQNAMFVWTGPPAYGGPIEEGLAWRGALQNALLVAPDPRGYGDPSEEVLAGHAQNRVRVAIAVGLEALNLPLLLLFVTGLHGLVGRRGGGGADWSRLAVAAGATLSAVMAFYAVLWIGVVLPAGELAEPSPVLELAWRMHAAAFAWSLPALGTTFIGAALSAHASGLTPSWQRLLGVAGGGLRLAAGAPTLAIADGSALVFVGVSGLAAWLVWLLATGVRLVRGDVDWPSGDKIGRAGWWG